jgi:hypothetical protein
MYDACEESSPTILTKFPNAPVLNTTITYKYVRSFRVTDSVGRSHIGVPTAKPTRPQRATNRIGVGRKNAHKILQGNTVGKCATEYEGNERMKLRWVVRREETGSRLCAMVLY